MRDYGLAHTVKRFGEIMEIKDKVISEIKKVYDPEIPVNIYDLGLIYSIQIKNQNEAYIDFRVHSRRVETVLHCLLASEPKRKIFYLPHERVH